MIQESPTIPETGGPHVVIPGWIQVCLAETGPLLIHQHCHSSASLLAYVDI